MNEMPSYLNLSLLARQSLMRFPFSGILVMQVFYRPTTAWIPGGILFGTGILFSLLTLKFQRAFVIIGTAVLGAGLITTCIDYFLEHFLLLRRWVTLWISFLVKIASGVVFVFALVERRSDMPFSAFALDTGKTSEAIILLTAVFPEEWSAINTCCDLVRCKRFADTLAICFCWRLMVHKLPLSRSSFWLARAYRGFTFLGGWQQDHCYRDVADRESEPIGVQASLPGGALCTKVIPILTLLEVIFNRRRLWSFNLRQFEKNQPALIPCHA